MLNIVVLDSNPAARQQLSQALRELRTPVERIGEVDTLPGALELLNPGGYDILFADASFFPAPADLASQFDQCLGHPLVIGVASPESAPVTAAAWGFVPDDLLFRPIDPIRLEWLVRGAGRKRGWFHLNKTLLQELLPEVLLGQSQPIQELRQLIRKVARTSATVLISGPPGAGKSVVAAEILRQSSRSQAPALSYDCSKRAEDRIERELFGVDGKATQPPRPGLLEWLDGGSLILQEVGHLSESAQNRLLRFLQTGQCERGGAWPSATLDARILATSSRPLEEWVSQRRFNEDLYLRLNLLPVAVPPLSNRIEDLPVLAEHFRQETARRLGVEVLAVAPNAQRALQQAAWPGNVRDLAAAVERAVLACPEGGILGPEHFGLADPADTPSGSKIQMPPPDLHEVEKRHIMEVLDYCGDNRTAAARVLGISIRTLRNKLREYREGAALPAQGHVAGLVP